MEENNKTPPEASTEDVAKTENETEGGWPPLGEDDFAVYGPAAGRMWRSVRPLVFVQILAVAGGLILAGTLWHRTPLQLVWIALGLMAIFRAVIIWMHDLVGFSYSQGFSVGKRPILRREIATPALLVAAVLLFLAATSTGVGQSLSSIFDVAATLFDALTGIQDLLGAALAVLLMLAFGAVSLLFVGCGLFFLLRFIIRGFRPHPEAGSGIGAVLVGVVALGVLGLGAYALVHNSDQALNETLAPYRTIWGWFK